MLGGRRTGGNATDYRLCQSQLPFDPCGCLLSTILDAILMRRRMNLRVTKLRKLDKRFEMLVTEAEKRKLAEKAESLNMSSSKLLRILIQSL